MSFSARVAQTVRRVRADDLPELRLFQREMFGADARQLNEARHAWLFDRNPCNGPAGPQLWISQKDGCVVGQQAGIPFELKVGDRFFHASWAIDLMVRPAYRLRGIGPALNDAYRDENTVTVGLGLSDAAYAAFRRAGWIDLGEVPLYVRPLRVGRMLNQRHGVSSAARAAAGVLQPLVSLSTAAIESLPLLRGSALQQIERFDERVDPVWCRASRHYPILARRDSRTLGWRFDEDPCASVWEKYYFIARGEVQGYVVLRSGQAHGASVGRVVDFLAEPKWLRTLFAHCLSHFHRAGAAAVYCCALGTELRRLMRLGFLTRRSGIRLLACPNPRRAAEIASIADPRCWFVTAADSDRDPGDDGRSAPGDSETSNEPLETLDRNAG